MKNSVLKNTQMQSPLLGLAQVRPKGKTVKKTIIANVLLTSLIDAFSILVIYLILNTSTSEEIIKDFKGVKLPQASATTSLDSGVVVKIENEKYFINNTEVSAKNLIKVLMKERELIEGDNKKASLIVQADKKDSYSLLNPILVSSAATGFETIKFAVIPSGGDKL